MAKPIRKKKKKTVAPEGMAFVRATFNNTIISLTDRNGNAISWASGGVAGAKGARKNTPFIATEAATKAAEEAMAMGLQRVEVRVNGPGPGREAAIRGLQVAGLDITSIKDTTPVPHNGCRPPKRRRV